LTESRPSTVDLTRGMLDANRRMIVPRHPTTRDLDQGWLVPLMAPRVLMNAPNDALLRDTWGAMSA
jgi:hypothetical protein